MSDPASLQVAVPVVRNLLIGVPVTVACVVLQASLVVWLQRQFHGRLAARPAGAFWRNVALVSAVMLVLVAGNVLQVAIWGLLFRVLGEFDRFGEAVYHSAVNFATLGYGDVVMSARHKLLGPIEAINGALMIGVSTAVLLSAFQVTFATAPAATGRR